MCCHNTIAHIDIKQAPASGTQQTARKQVDISPATLFSVKILKIHI